jgi:hypothetical protein
LERLKPRRSHGTFPPCDWAVSLRTIEQECMLIINLTSLAQHSQESIFEYCASKVGFSIGAAFGLIAIMERAICMF